jgi:ABC-type bacteriocin/lantibiotic exporter with double-glycine peptidase domain
MLFYGAVVVCCMTAAATAQERWLDVPFVSQPEEGCGAAAISMTLQYWKAHGVEVAPHAYDVEAIQKQLYSPKEGGIRASALKQYFLDHDFRTFAFRGEPKDLDEHIAKGRPLIVALRPSSSSRALHYVVVAGTDPGSRLVLVNDPAQKKLLKVHTAEFEKQWAGTDYWTLLVLPKT